MALREREDVGECMRLSGGGAGQLGQEVVEPEADGAVVDVGGERGNESVRDEASVEEELVGRRESGEEGRAVAASDAVRCGYGVRC